MNSALQFWKIGFFLVRLMDNLKIGCNEDCYHQFIEKNIYKTAMK